MLEKIKSLLKSFQDDEIFDDLYFVGGTALSFYLNHRISYDIDFICDKKLNQKILNNMVVKYDAKFIPDPNESTFKINSGEDIRNYKMQFMIDDVKIEFFYPNDGLRVGIVKKYKKDFNLVYGVKRLPIEAIGRLKLIALFNRNKIRDLFDIFYLFYKNYIDCDDIDRFLALRYTKTFVEFLDEFYDDESESLDFLENQEFSYMKKDRLLTLKEIFKIEYIKRCL